MSLISFSPLQDGVTGVNSAATNTPLSTIYNDYNGNITNANIATGAAIAGSKIAYGSISNPYKFSVYRSSALNSASAAFTKLAFDTKLYDTGSNFDATTNFKFTAPIAGFYHFSWAVESSATASRWIAALYKNASTEVARGSDMNVSASPNSSVGSKDLQLAANDTIEVQLFANAAIAISVGLNICYLDGFLISAT